jgi:hypothetical protein
MIQILSVQWLSGETGFCYFLFCHLPRVYSSSFDFHWRELPWFLCCICDYSCVPFLTRYPFFFLPAPIFRCPLRVLPLTSCLLSVEIRTVVQVTSVFVYLMTWSGYDCWHSIFLWQLLCNLSFGSPVSSYLGYSKFYSSSCSKTYIQLEAPPYFVVSQTLNSGSFFMCLTIIDTINIFWIKNDSQVCSILFYYPPT